MAIKSQNYARYYGLLVDDRPKHQEYLREWSIFLNNFKTYFFHLNILNINV
uniref:VP1054 n=1 Tax=Pieris brassicae granulosis virus TaxID=10465 RepID=A0A7G9U8L2_GVPB|nr:VP1054 [Pieris brassicae granulovirus]